MQTIAEQVIAARKSMTYEQRVCAKKIDISRGLGGMFDPEKMHADVQAALKESRDRRVAESMKRDDRIATPIGAGFDSPKSLCERTGMNPNLIKAALRRLIEVEKIACRLRGRYIKVKKK